MRKFKSNCLLAMLLTLGMVGAHAQHVENASAIREVLGDGAKITTAVITIRNTTCNYYSAFIGQQWIPVQS